MHDGDSEFPDIFFVATGRYVDQDPRRKSCAFPMFSLWQHMHAEPGQQQTYVGSDRNRKAGERDRKTAIQMSPKQEDATQRNSEDFGQRQLFFLSATCVIVTEGRPAGAASRKLRPRI
jgi:hypothetical protein